MSVLSPPLVLDEVVYPESDGKPMADNSLQLHWIVVLFGNLAAVFDPRADVYVGANLLWYPRWGHPETSIAPDVFVVFGRHKGHRGSYQQWKEGDVPLTVVFEVLSPGNEVVEMIDKHLFYEEHGVQEYYLFDPSKNRLHVFVRSGEVFRAQRADGFVSPQLGIRFDLSGPEMVVYSPGGERFLSFEELQAERVRERQGRLAAQEQVEKAQGRADEAEHRLARALELIRKARRGQASPEELLELEHLEDEASPS